MKEKICTYWLIQKVVLDITPRSNGGLSLRSFKSGVKVAYYELLIEVAGRLD